MVLYLENNYQDQWQKNDADVVEKYIKSKYAVMKWREPSVRLVLFLADEFKSTTSMEDFDRVLGLIKEREVKV